MASNQTLTASIILRDMFTEVSDRVSRSMRGMQDEARQTQTTFERMQGASGSLMAVGGAASLMGIGVAAGLGAAVKTGVDFDAQMSRVGAIAGASSSELDRLRQSALELGAATSKSATEVSAGQEKLAALGMTTKEILSAMPGVISASEASGADMAQTAEVVASALNVWGMKATEASRVSDILAETANRTAADITDMQYALKYAGPPAAALGISLEETAASIGLLTNAGMKGEQAGTTLRGGLLALLKPSEETGKLMQTLGINLTDASGEFVGMAGLVKNLKSSFEGMTNAQKLASLAQLVGTESASGFLTLMKAGPSGINKMTKSLENSAGASKEAADKMKDNLKGALEEMTGAAESAQIALGDGLKGPIRSAATLVTGLVNAFNMLPQSMKTMIAVSAATLAAVLILGGGIAILVGLLPMLIEGFALVAPFIAPVAVTIGVVVGSLALLVAGFKAAWTYSDKFRGGIQGLKAMLSGDFVKARKIMISANFNHEQIDAFRDRILSLQASAKSVGEKFKQVGTLIKGVFASLVGNNGASASILNRIGLSPAVILQIFTITGKIRAVLSSAFSAIVNLAKSVFSKIRAFWQSDGAQLMQAVRNVFQGIWSVIQFIMPVILFIIKGIWGNIKGVIQGALNVILGVVKIFSGLFTGDFKKMWEGVKQAFFGAIQFIWNYVNLLLVGRVLGGFRLLATSGKSIITGFWGAIKAFFSGGIASIKATVASGFNYVKSNISNVLSATRGFIGNMFKGYVSIVQGAVKLIWSAVKTGFNLVSTIITTVMRTAGKLIETTWSAIRNTFRTASDIIKGIVTKVFGNFGKTVDDAMAAVSKAVRAGWDDAVKFLKDIDLGKIGKNIIRGLVDGMASGFTWVSDKVSELTDLIPSWFSKGLQVNSPARTIIPIGASTVEGHEVGMKQRIPALQRMTQTVISQGVITPFRTQSRQPLPPTLNTKSTTNKLDQSQNAQAQNVFNVHIRPEDLGALGDDPAKLEQMGLTFMTFIADKMEDLNRNLPQHNLEAMLD
ncbi:phage tail tape measure protein [Exiguobacterium sp. S22-S28]|uniref:phage tail tape measure protein n=1 Tax=Exiguobacterium sp. S22-S28 TaxID=3342768 RepID=UPI00372D60CB